MSMSHEAPPEALAGEAAPDRQIRPPLPIPAASELPGLAVERMALHQFHKVLRAEVADLREHCAHLEFANGCLQERLAALEAQVEAMKSTIGQVVVLAAAVDSAGLESVGAKLGRMAAKRAEVASRCDMGGVGAEGRLTHCPVVGCGLGGTSSGLAHTGNGGPCE